MSAVPFATSLPERRLAPVGNAALLLAWAWAASPALAWSARAMGREDQRLQLVLLALFAAWALPGARPAVIVGALSAAPALRSAPIGLAIASAAGLAVGQRSDIDLLTACSAWIGLFALAGLYLAPSRWRAAAAPVLLLVALLPFSTHLDVVLGFPARVATAEIVAGALSASGIAAVPSETVLRVDGASLAVDLPCAGMRSLWAGAVFLLGAAIAQRRALDLRLGLVAGALAAMLFAANTARVLILAGLDLVLGWPTAADGVHVPLGVVGFVLSCAAAGALMMRIPAVARAEDPPAVGLPALAPALAALWLVVSLVPAAPAPPPLAAITIDDATALPLTAQEVEYYAGLGVSGVTAWRFERGDLSGRAILVPSADWRAHHLPEQCLGAAGSAVTGSRPARVGDLPVRIADVGGGAAIWWFQSADAVTDDHARRVLSGMVGGPTPWVMVSILLDDRATPDDPHLAALLAELRADVSASLELP